MASNQVWIPIEYLPKTRCSCDNCTNSYGMESETLLTLRNKSIGNISVVLPDGLRLCELVDAPAAVTIPDEVREAIRLVVDEMGSSTDSSPASQRRGFRLPYGAS